jgi:hypothetical protein
MTWLAWCPCLDKTESDAIAYNIEQASEAALQHAFEVDDTIILYNVYLVVKLRGEDGNLLAFKIMRDSHGQIASFEVDGCDVCDNADEQTKGVK